MIAANIQRIQQQLGDSRLVVVSKFRSIPEIRTAYDVGQRLFAENRVQALLERREQLPADIEWHLIGHLQTNKVKFIAPFISMIHSVDSPKLLQEIQKEAEKNGRVIPVLMQVHIAMEETKFGWDSTELNSFLRTAEFKNMGNISIAGLMGMATLTADEQQIRREFSGIKNLFDKLKNEFFSSDNNFKELSIGMSSDYLLALENGSTMVRIGSAIFS